LKTYDEAFDEETDPKARLAMTRQLSEVYMQEGKLEDLISRFRERQRAEEGGWRYAQYLAEIFQQMQDFGAAREELSKALVARSRDGGFIRQLLRLAEMESNNVEMLRYTRMLAEVEPSEENQIQLVILLLNTGETEEALTLLRANQENLLKDPAKWRDIIVQVQTMGVDDALSEQIRLGLEKRADDWKARLAISEIQIALGNMDAAERMLWEIVSMKEESVSAAPVPAPAPPAAVQGGGVIMPVSGSGRRIKLGGGGSYINPFYYGGGGSGKLQMRINRAQNAMQTLTQSLSQMGVGGEAMGAEGDLPLEEVG